MSKEGNLYDALIWRLGQMVKDNVELEQRVHQLVGDYNRVVKQLHGREKHDNTPTGCTLGELTEALDKYEALEETHKSLLSEYNRLIDHCVQLQTECDAAKTRVANCEHQKEELFKEIERFKQSAFVEMGYACTFLPFAPNDSPVKVGSGKCKNCRHLMKADVFGKKCVLCACRYDNTKSMETQEKNTDE